MRVQVRAIETGGRWLLRQNGSEQRMYASFKRQLRREQLVQDHAEAVLIRRRGQLVGITFDLLFRHIGWRTDERAMLRDLG